MRPSPVTGQPDHSVPSPVLSAPDGPSRRSRVPRLLGYCAGTFCFALLLLSLWRISFPSPPARLTLQVTFPPGIAGQVEPLLTTGRTDDGDFLALRYLDTDHAVVLYDVWGVGGPTSAPFALKPGQPRTLEIELPTLPHVPTVRRRETRPLRVTLEGATLLDQPVFFHRRAPHEIYFATNPIGGTLVAPQFRGQLALASGQPLLGGPKCLFSLFDRLAWIVAHRWYLVFGYAVAGALAGLLVARLTRLLASVRLPRFTFSDPTLLPPTHVQAPHRWFVATAVLSALAFTALLTAGTFRLITPDIFGDFYDHQARALLRGQLHLSEAARTSESFIFENRIYIYFGPTPAILRLPLIFFDVAFGQLSRCFMLGYFLAALAAVYALQLHVARLAGGRGNFPSRFAVVLLTAAAGLGSTIFFLAARTYVYHEAILCGLTFALWSSYFSLRWLAEPPRAWWLAALACGIASVHARPPTGLFALCVLGTAAIAIALRALFSAPRARFTALLRPFLIAVAAALGILSFNGLSYLKFKSFDGAPLRYHVEYQNNHRIAHIQGRNFHASNIPFNFDHYAWRPTFTLSKNFPYLHFHRPLADPYVDARLDLVEPTLALPYAMPALVFLALLSFPLAFTRFLAARIPVLVIVVGALPMTLALLAAVAISQRYTGDFVPLLLLLSAFALQALPHAPARLHRPFVTATAVLATLGVLVTFAISLHYQGAMVWGIPHDVQQRYTALRKNIDTFFGVANPTPLRTP